MATLLKEKPRNWLSHEFLLVEEEKTRPGPWTCDENHGGERYVRLRLNCVPLPLLDLHISLCVSLCNKRKLVNLTFVTTVLSAELTRGVNIMFSCAAAEALWMHRPKPGLFLWGLSATVTFHFSIFLVLLPSSSCVLTWTDPLLPPVFKHISLHWIYSWCG